MATKQELLDLNDRAIRAWNDHDAKAVVELFATRFEWKDADAPEVITTQEGLIDYTQAQFEAFSDMTIQVLDVIASSEDSAVAGVVKFRGTHDGPIPVGDREIPASGRRIEVEGSYLARVSNGKITKFTTFTNTLDMLQQVGAL